MNVAATPSFVIFAAGTGSRLAADVPKLLVNVGRRAVFAHQLDQLRRLPGCVYIVCGYRAPAVCDAVSRFIRQLPGPVPQVCFVYNPEFHHSQVTSIDCALKSIPLNRTAYFIDGDLLFHRDVIEQLHCADGSQVLVRREVSPDAVIAITDGNRLKRFQRGAEGPLEWSNIAKYEPPDLQRLVQIASGSTATHHFDLINHLVDLGSDIGVQENVVAEIDQPEDLPAAVTFVEGLR